MKVVDIIIKKTFRDINIGFLYHIYSPDFTGVIRPYFSYVLTVFIQI